MEDFAEILNQNLDGWNRAMGVRFVRVTLDEVVAELTVGAEHKQAYGIVHGGVYAGVIETLASVGAAMNAMQQGRSAVGLENNTSFLQAVREGTLRGTARPIMRGKRSQVWEATITDESGRAVATGRVRLMVLEGDAKLAGKQVTLERE
jgi:1,4-dihydroxy-2-naphthoyl-CoA hydrolase